jgi:hypothetical protein
VYRNNVSNVKEGNEMFNTDFLAVVLRGYWFVSLYSKPNNLIQNMQ